MQKSVLFVRSPCLLLADDDQRLWNPLVQAALYDYADRLTDLGRLTPVKLALSAVANWLDRIPAAEAQQQKWLRERSVLINRQGNVLMAQGDLAGALGAYEKGLEGSRRLTEADPSNAGWQRDLSFILTRMAEYHELAGNRTAPCRSPKRAS